MTKNDIHDIHPLDEEERELIEMYESGEMIASPTQAQDMAEAKEAAENYLNKAQKVSIHISKGD